MTSLTAISAAVAAGGVVGIPTDTVYGLACDPADPLAVERIYAIKHRPAGLELTLLSPDREAIADLVLLTPPTLELAERFWPGPLSIVLPLGVRRLAVPRSGATLSVRVPDHALLLRLLRVTGPLASTSANRHGEPPALTAAQVRASLGAELDGVLDGGSGGGLPSTIIDAASTPPRLLREGPVSAALLSPHLRGPQSS